MGSRRLMLRTLARMAVQRHSAASRSASPRSSGQQVSAALGPMPMWISPPRRSTQAPSLRVLMGQPLDTGAGGGGHGTVVGGGGGGQGISLGGGGGGQGISLGGGGGG
ncbi:unnamed protein product [Spirodela intermedia]|uniref:Uncharacterized protein n=1 Tax=Spirodela intermedia TaxID=51605 RepID=A0A7I8L8D0_SPIIN|nr:unnamed protein product [Spirodela intermedia]